MNYTRTYIVRDNLIHQIYIRLWRILPKLCSNSRSWHDLRTTELYEASAAMALLASMIQYLFLEFKTVKLYLKLWALKLKKKGGGGDFGDSWCGFAS